MKKCEGCKGRGGRETLNLEWSTLKLKDQRRVSPFLWHQCPACKGVGWVIDWNPVAPQADTWPPLPGWRYRTFAGEEVIVTQILPSGAIQFEAGSYRGVFRDTPTRPDWLIPVYAASVA